MDPLLRRHPPAGIIGATPYTIGMHATHWMLQSRMIPSGRNPYGGVYAATLTPLHPDGRIDEPRLARHFADLAAVDGIVGVLCNGHAGENYLLSREERSLVTRIAARTIGDHAIIVSGVLSESPAEAAQHAVDARQAGADAVLVFPPFSWALSQDDTMAVRHHQAIDAAVSMPMVLYQAGARAGTLAYKPDVLARLALLPNVVAVKEGSWETAAYDANRRLLADIAPNVLCMASGDEHLLPCFAIGSAGSMVSLAAVMPRDIVALDRAVQRGDLPAARAIHERLQPLATAIYGAAPPGYAAARLKLCLELLGHWQDGRPRAPLGPLPAQERARLRAALIRAGLLEGAAP
jgi:4-hydroxy-tetrahydrodipicolinate synthase